MMIYKQKNISLSCSLLSKLVLYFLNLKVRCQANTWWSNGSMLTSTNSILASHEFKIVFVDSNYTQESKIKNDQSPRIFGSCTFSSGIYHTFLPFGPPKVKPKPDSIEKSLWSSICLNWKDLKFLKWTMKRLKWTDEEKEPP